MRNRGMLGFVVTTFAVISLAAAAPAARDMGTSMPTAVSGATTTATAPAVPAVSVTTRSVSQTALSTSQLNETVGESWLSDFFDGVRDGMLTAMVYVIIIVIAT